MALVDCPECGKQVSSNATACPNCGEPIAAATLPASPGWSKSGAAAEMKDRGRTASERNKERVADRRNGCLVIFGIFVVLAVIGSLLGDDSDSTSEYVFRPAEGRGTTPEAPRPIVNGDLRAMIKECDANQVAFEDKWQGTTVRISGVVKEIDAGVLGGSLRMRKPGGSRYDSISFGDIPRDVLGRLSKGDDVTVQCERVFEVMGDPTFSDCVVK
jgi:hypothetical protein